MKITLGDKREWEEVLITTTSGIAAGLKPPVPFVKNAFTGEASGQIHNLGVVAGNPGAWTLAAPGMAGVAVTANALGGALRFDNPTSGFAYLAQLAASLGANIAALILYDLLWYQSGIAETTTTGQTINSVAFPARDIAASVNGDGIEAFIHCTTATTNGAAVTNTTLGYTNEAGTASRSAGLAYEWPATAVAGTMVPFGLQGSDRGVRSIQTVTLGTSYGGGQIELIAARRIAHLTLADPDKDWAKLALPRIFSDSALYGAVLLSGTQAGLDGVERPSRTARRCFGEKRSASAKLDQERCQKTYGEKQHLRRGAGRHRRAQVPQHAGPTCQDEPNYDPRRRRFASRAIRRG